MPIDYSKYPPNWKEIRQRILVRAKNCCEECGLLNYSFVHTYKENGETIWQYLENPEKRSEKGSPKLVRVILTIAHLDHDETNHNVTDDRLKAMCQLCHLRYDAEEKKRRRLKKNDRL